MSAFIDKHLARECFNVLKLTGDDPIICQKVMRIDRNKNEDMIFLCSIQLIAFFEKTNQISLINKEHVNKLSSVNLIDRNKIQIIVDKFSITFEHTNAVLLYKSFISHLKSILTNQELPNLDYNPKITGKIPGSQNLMKRFAYLNTGSKDHADKKVIDFLSQLMAQKKLKTLDFSKNNILVPYLDIILDCLEFQPSITTVIIPRGSKSNWSSIANCLKTNSTIKHLYINEPFDHDFMKVVNNLSQNQNTKLHRITFNETNMKQSDSNYLRALFALNIIDHIEFSKCFTSDIFSNMLQVLVRESGFKSVINIGFNSILNLHADEIFVAMPFLSSISFENCNINLSSAIRYMSPTIRKIRVIGGTALSEMPQFNVPKTLIEVTLSNIKWTPQSLCLALEKFCSHNPGEEKYSVSFENVDMPNEWWNDFSLKNLNITPSPMLDIFSWDENPISSTITNMLKQLKGLVKLSANGSLEPETTLPFCEFVNQCESLRILKLKGGRHPLGNDCITLLRGLRNCSKITELSLDNQNFGDEGAIALADLLNDNKNISYCQFGNNRMMTKDIWYTFFEKVMNRGPPLEIPWPEEIISLYNAGVLKQKDLDHIHDCWKNTKNGREENDLTSSEDGLSHLSFDFGQSDENESEQAYEKPVDIDWEIKLPSIELPNTSDIVNTILDQNSYMQLIQKMYRI